MATGKKFTVWFTVSQIEVLRKIQEIDGDINTSSAIREGLKLYLKTLQTK
jgi:hypothetical protein